MALYIDPLQYQPPDILDELFIDPSDPVRLTEAHLEYAFGLRMTTREPLEPDFQSSSYVEARIRYLRNIVRYSEDWPANPPADAAPLIDPDVVSPLDMVIAELTPLGVVRVPNVPIHLWEDRQRQLNQWRMAIQEIREHPDGGYSALITDESIVNGRVIRHNVGIGISIQAFEALIKRRRAGEDISVDLDVLYLSLEAFDLFTSVWETLQLLPPGPILKLEWDAVYDILV